MSNKELCAIYIMLPLALALILWFLIDYQQIGYHWADTKIGFVAGVVLIYYVLVGVNQFFQTRKRRKD